MLDPLPGGHGSLAHERLTVTVELVTPLLIVLTTVTSQVIAVVAPPGPGPMLLHWLMATFAARAGGELAVPAKKNVVVSRTIAAAMCHTRWREVPRAGAMPTFIEPRSFAGGRDWSLWTRDKPHAEDNLS